MATVTINDLQCGVTYNITAEGALNGILVGPKSPHGNVTAGPCPVIASECRYSMKLYIYIIMYVRTYLYTYVSYTYCIYTHMCTFVLCMLHGQNKHSCMHALVYVVCMPGLAEVIGL